jgi:16S rRNA (uracil1498-N3)-methyltransferase
MFKLPFIIVSVFIISLFFKLIKQRIDKIMPRFFTDKVSGSTITVTGDDARHIGRSLRMKIGDDITFCNNGIDYLCRIDSISDSKVVCSIAKSFPAKSEPTIMLTLYQALPKQDKLELIIQKTTELGVSRIVPFLSKRCVARPDKKEFDKKLERLKKISLEAAKQAGRGIVPEVAPLMTFEEAVCDMQTSDIKIICYENEGKKLSETGIDSSKSVAVMIGSEGGFERGEVDRAVSGGAVPVWLGRRILRCETCPIAVSAVIMSLSGNM